MKAMSRTFLGFVVFLAFGACGERESETPRRELTQEQRDSILAETPLPGAKVVGRAIEAADSAAARSERLNDRAE